MKNMKKVIQLTAAAGLTALLIFGLINNDNLQIGGRRWTATEESPSAFVGDDDAVEVPMKEDSFASRRQHLDAVCDKYDDLYRPEYFNLYRKVHGPISCTFSFRNNNLSRAKIMRSRNNHFMSDSQCSGTGSGRIHII